MKTLFNTFLKNFMIGILIFSVISSIAITLALNFVVYMDFPLGIKFIINIFCVLIISIGLIMTYKKRKKLLPFLQKQLENKNLIVYVMIVSFLIRLIWISLVNTFPVSDFEIMYNSAREVSLGNFSCFHDLNYFARFTHDTIIVLYYSIFFKFSSNPIFIIKTFNVLLSVLSVLMIYFIMKELFGYKSAVLSAILLSLFPPFIMYTSQLLSENIAMPFYLLSIYCFVKYINNILKYKWILFSGLALSFGNMFRMVGIIFLIAYIMYLFIYTGVKNSIKTSILTIFMFIIPIYITSTLLLNIGITESNLWSPKETAFTSILKGTNLNSFGFWNQEDSDMPAKYNYDYYKVKEESLRLIKQRLLGSPIYKVIGLYIGKLGGELGFSDYGAFEFTVLDSRDSIGSSITKYFGFTVFTLINLFHLFLLYFSIIYLKSKKTLPTILNLFLILYLGFAAFYLITEVQPRYSFIICWTLVIFATKGLNTKLCIDSKLSNKYTKTSLTL